MSDCKEIQDECVPVPRAAQAWSVCLPWGGRIWSDGNGVYATPGSPPPDGTYGTITIAGGCIVGVGPVEVPLYTGSPCAPLPGNCGRAATAAVADAAPVALLADEPPSLMQGNLYTQDPAGRPLVRCYIEAGVDITVSGDGSLTNPYVISAPNISVTPVRLKSANDAISVTGDGTIAKPFVVDHKEGRPISKDGFVFDRYGHLVDVNSGSVNQGVQAILPGNGISVKPNLETRIPEVSVQRPAGDVQGEFMFGGVMGRLDDLGRFQTITQAIDFGGNQTVHMGVYDVSLNAYGSITGIVNSADMGVARFLWWGLPEGEVLTRGGRFTLPSNTSLCGLFFTNAEQEFLETLAFRIDDTVCAVGHLSPTPLVFSNNSVFAQGEHVFEVVSAVPWPAVGAFAILLAAAPPLETWDRT